MQLNTILKILCILSIQLIYFLASAKIKLEDYAKLMIKIFDHNKESSITIFHYSENDGKLFFRLYYYNMELIQLIKYYFLF